MRLLLGFKTPEKGAIYYDGKDLTRLDLRSLRRRIGAVTQDGSLFQGDIYSNIVISSPKLTLDKGRIMEDGTYDELIAQNGLFAELVARQRLDAPPE